MHLKEKPSIVFLLALWGESYIKNFFHFSLRSLLASGNIPAMSKDYACTFIFLTTQYDIEIFQAQAIFAKLQSYCTVEFIEISDIIFDGNYSATLTLAFERGMKSRGTKMCETYFFFLVSDYIMANGSLNNLKPYLEAGYSGITSGNFLVVEEHVAHDFENIIASNSDEVLALSARELLKLALPHIHPVSTAQTVTQSFTHATHANRLFWKVSETTIIGRFYLRHMLCIKPEIDNYIIGSSCDYSFISEMCPSNNVFHLQDSDVYCIIEMSPFNYEQQWIKPGPFDLTKLALLLSEWTTAAHRLNAYIPIIYHTENLNDDHVETIQKSLEMVQQLESMLSCPPKPTRGHPYWISCVESIFHWLMGQPDKERFFRNGMCAGIIGSPTFSHIFPDMHDDRVYLKVAYPPPSMPLSKKSRHKLQLKKKVTGRALNTTRWHLSWLDDVFMKKQLHKHNQPFICMAFEPIPEVVRWFEHHFPEKCIFQYYNLFVKRTESELRTFLQNKQHAIIWTQNEQTHALTVAIRKLAHYLPKGSTISVYLLAERAVAIKQMQKKISICLADLVHTSIRCETMDMQYNVTKDLLLPMQARLLDKAFGPKKGLLIRFTGFIGLLALHCTAFVSNCVSTLCKPPKTRITSVVLKLRR